MASFDSELMLVKKDKYTLNFWLPNPFFLPWRSQKTAIDKSDVIMVSRLDGADASIIKRIVNDSIEAEKRACPVRPILMPDGKILVKKKFPDTGFMINPSIMRQAV